MTTHRDYESREATADELARLSHSLRWAYERGEPLALWYNTGVITFYASHMTPADVLLLCRQRGKSTAFKEG